MPMNCFEFQHEMNRQPDALSEAAQNHLRHCASCQRRLREQRELDAALRDALTVTPPHGLAEHILLQQRLRQQQRQRWPVLVAASIAALLLAGAWLHRIGMNRDDTLAAAMAEHVLDEPALFRQRHPLDGNLVATSIASIGGHIRASLPLALATPCDVPGGDGAHLVFETRAGRAVMTTMPNHSGTSPPVEDEAVVSVIYRAPRGVYSLVAHNSTAIRLTREMLNSRIDWQI